MQSIHSVRLRRVLVAGPVGALLAVGLALVPATTVQARTVVHTRAEEVSGPLDGSQVRRLPFAAQHIALFWAGNPEAKVTVALSIDGVTFGDPLDAERDDVGAGRRDGRTYGAVLAAHGATAVQVSSDRPLGRLTVLAMAQGGTSVTKTGSPSNQAGAQTLPVTALAPSEVASRGEWGADEELRFNGDTPLWSPVFQTTQKLVVHHTAGANNQSGADAVATINAIYRYHTVTQGWGDIGYNFLIDAAGKVYKGRSTSAVRADEDRTGENAWAQGVTAGHAYGYNSGTIGVALLGNFDSEAPTSAARTSLERFLTWKAGAHGLDALGSSLYTNPVNGSQVSFANVPGHSQVPENSTACPGAHLLSALPAIRSVVSNSAGPPDRASPSAPSDLKATSAKRSVILNWTATTDSGSVVNGVAGGVSGVGGYDVYRQAGRTVTRLGSTTGPTFTDSNPKRGSTYYVRAFDGAGNRSANSNTVQFS